MIYVILALAAFAVLEAWIIKEKERMLDELSDKLYYQSLPIDPVDAVWQPWEDDTDDRF